MLLAVLTIPQVLAAPTPEDEYFQTRNGFVRRFKKELSSIDDKPALAQLEKRLRKIIGPIRLEGLSQPGRINLQTLPEDAGVGQVDGLRFESDHETIVVTTQSLLQRYLTEYPHLPKSIRKLSKTGELYALVFHLDAEVIYFAELPVTSGKGQTFSHAFLGLSAQDIGHFLPQDIFVLVVVGD
jgi:hypothetical protein